MGPAGGPTEAELGGTSWGKAGTDAGAGEAEPARDQRPLRAHERSAQVEEDRRGIEHSALGLGSTC